MSDDLMRKKIQLRTVKPILKKRQHEMDNLRQRMTEKKSVYETSQQHYMQKLSHKEDVVDKIESMGSREDTIDVIGLNNARHYLNEILQQLEQDKETLREQKQAAEYATEQLKKCHVDVRILEQYQADKGNELSVLIEKLRSKEMEDLWLQAKYTQGRRENDYE